MRVKFKDMLRKVLCTLYHLPSCRRAFRRKSDLGRRAARFATFSLFDICLIIESVGPPDKLYGFKGLRPPAADPQQNEGMMLRGYENHEAIALVTCAS